MADSLNDFLNQCATESVNAHIAPEPIEAPEEHREQRRRDLVREEAVRLGRLAQLQGGPDAAAAFCAGVEAYERHLSRHDYRGRK